MQFHDLTRQGSYQVETKYYFIILKASQLETLWPVLSRPAIVPTQLSKSIH